MQSLTDDVDINTYLEDQADHYENGVQFQIKSLPSLRLSSFIVSEDIISILVDENFTMNATGMVLESLC